MTPATINHYTSPIKHGDRASAATIKQGDGTEHVLVCRGGSVDGRTESIRKMSEKTIAQVLAQGESLVRNDGAVVWRERRPLFNPAGASALERYTWHEDGIRVRAEWFEMVQRPDGTTEENRLRRVWVAFENA